MNENTNGVPEIAVPFSPTAPHEQALKSYDGNEPFIFISYSHSDVKKATTVISLLKQNHYRFWYDEGIKTGSEWADFICDKIKKCDQFVVFISSESIMSENVKDEVHIAKKNNKNIIVVYFERVELSGGLELSLDRKQAINYYGLSHDDFESRFIHSMNDSCIQIDFFDVHTDNNKEKRYLISKTLSRKGYQNISLATDTHTGSKVVIKEVIKDSSLKSKETLNGLEREKEVLSTVESPYTPKLIDYYEKDGRQFLVESYASGTLISKLENCSISKAIYIIISVIKSLKYLHSAGYLHADITPNNIIINSHDDVFLIDFGASQKIGISSETVFGTPGFYPPELRKCTYRRSNNQIEALFEGYSSKNMGIPIDIYGLGMTLYYLLTLEYKIEQKDIVLDDSGQTVLQRTHAIIDDIKYSRLKDQDYYSYLNCEDVPNLMTIDNKRFDYSINAIIHKMIDRVPENRYQNVDELMQDLEDYKMSHMKKRFSLKCEK